MFDKASAVNVNDFLGAFLKTFDLTHFPPNKIVKKSKSVVLNINSTIVQNLYIKTFHQKKTKSVNLIFFHFKNEQSFHYYTFIFDDFLFFKTSEL